MVPEQAFIILVNAFNCRFQLWIADAFTRYTVQTAIICVCGYKLKEMFPQVCLAHLYTLEGAIHNIEFNCLSEDRKKELKEFIDFLKK